MTNSESKALAIPDWAKDLGMIAGAEDIRPEDIKRPYLKLVQKTSKEFDADPTLMGHFMNSGNGTDHGTMPIVTILRAMPPVWRKFNDTKQLVASSSDGMSWSNGTYLTADEKWKSVRHDFFVIIEGTEMPLILSFASMSSRAGKDLRQSLASFVSGNKEPIFLRNYTLISNLVKNDKGSFFTIGFKVNGGFNSKDDCERYAEMRRALIDISIPIQPPVVITEEDMKTAIDTGFGDEPLDIE
ncbi:hypothetical protein UFOVP1009_35 [uncultured Caudovirales phage]|uniref:Uncharacterized protein n=1 Tax=uncultured Caudovirales phage TaxID=2100421 RepID=A0A6J5Q163_9CAUD|nr:hypothetical protein UFOVP1009_35 [uncultured Caudovirales phage]